MEKFKMRVYFTQEGLDNIKKKSSNGIISAFVEDALRETLLTKVMPSGFIEKGDIQIKLTLDNNLIEEIQENFQINDMRIFIMQCIKNKMKNEEL